MRPVIVDRAGIEVLSLTEVINPLHAKQPTPTSIPRRRIDPPRILRRHPHAASACSIPPSRSWTRTMRRNRRKNRRQILKARQDSIDVADVRGPLPRDGSRRPTDGEVVRSAELDSRTRSNHVKPSTRALTRSNLNPMMTKLFDLSAMSAAREA